MDLLITVLLGASLAADAFAVSVARSVVCKDSNRNLILMAGSFGFFQALMPILGWLAGMRLMEAISGIDHWVAFGLLVVIGAKMIYESRVIKREEEHPALDGQVLLLLSLATSIDALAVGLSLSFISVEILEPALIIGLVTFAISLSGCFIGRRFGRMFEDKAELAAGLVLICIGLKVLVDHIGLPF